MTTEDNGKVAIAVAQTDIQYLRDGIDEIKGMWKDHEKRLRHVEKIASAVSWVGGVVGSGVLVWFLARLLDTIP